MSEHTVDCGCGRAMRPDALHGRGAYRCGCGARVRIAFAADRPAAACVGNDHGRPCRMPPVTDKPFRLCLDHYRSSGLKRFHEWLMLDDEQLARRVVALRHQELVEQADDEGTAYIYQRYHDALTGAWHLMDNPEAARRHAEENDPENRGFVYFIRYENRVKIGKSVDPKKRLDGIRCGAPGAYLIATERGYTQRERALHNKFASYHIAGEWFSLGPRLIAYINELRKAAHERPIKVPEAPVGQGQNRAVTS